jgi:hypothetical protein
MIIGAGGPSYSWLLRILNGVLRCSHQHQSRPITPRGGGQTYAVCLDCGTRLAYDLKAMRGEASVPGSSLNRQTPLPGAPGPWATMWHDSLRFHREFGTTAVLWLGAVSLAGGLLYLPNRPAGPKNLTTPEQARASPSADSVRSSPSLPIQERDAEALLAPQENTLAIATISTQPESTTGTKTIEPDSTSTSEAARSNQVLHLESKGSVIVLGREAGAVLELSQHPERLSRLIKRGFLFTVPRGTAIKLLQGNRLENGFVIKVLIMEGSMVGQQGWAQPEQARLLSSADSVKSWPSMQVQEGGSEVASDPETTELIANPAVATEPTSTTGERTIESDPTSASAAARSNQVLHLEGKGSVIVLGREVGAALELSQHPERLSRLIKRGSLFTVSRGTAIKPLQRDKLGGRSVIKVLIVNGSKVGQEGWAQTSQVSP